jgi:hypothetical protein
VVCVGLAPAAGAWTSDDALAAALLEHRALLEEARQLRDLATLNADSGSPLAHVDAFEAVLIEQRLLAPESAAKARAAPVPAVSTGPHSAAASDADEELGRLARLVASDASEARVERELEAHVRDQQPAPDAAELVQDVLFRAVALTAVALREKVDELRRSEAFQSALRERARALTSSVASASEEARAKRDRELRRVERELGAASRRASRASFDLDGFLRDHEALFARFARLGRSLHARAKAALRELES